MIEQFLQRFYIQGNWVDLALLLVIVFFILNHRGVLQALFELAVFLLSLSAAYKLYDFVGMLMVSNFSLPHGIANAVGFFIAWSVVESILFIIISLLIGKYLAQTRDNEWNKRLGFIPATIHALVLFLFFISLVFAFPVQPWVKQDILESRTGPYFVSASHSLESRIKAVFGKAVSESLNFMTIKPKSDETVDLGIKLSKEQASYSATAEQKMIQMVNKERTQRGIKPLTTDHQLRDVARLYAMEMFTHGFFSHVSQVDGSTAADRVTRAGISFMVVGENLAFAPDVYLAHQGLMNSEGHRKNILFDEYGRIGIGVVDGGPYGQMFVQLFAD